MDRAYPSPHALIENESKRTDRADVIAVMTPNDSHYEICSLAMAAGFHLVCDKPLTTDLTTAVSLARKVKSTGTEFCLTHCYTGYPRCAKPAPWSRQGRSASSASFIFNTSRDILLLRTCPRVAARPSPHRRIDDPNRHWNPCPSFGCLRHGA